MQQLRLKLWRGKWAVVWHDGITTRRKSLGTADRKIAERRFKDVKIERPDDTVADAVSLYLKAKEESSKSYGSMLTSWRAVEPTFGHLRPDQITRDLCKSYAQKRQKAHISNGTIRRDLGMLRAALKWTKRDHDAQFQFPEAPPPRDRWLTRAEYDRLLEACALPHIYLFVLHRLAEAGESGIANV